MKKNLLLFLALVPLMAAWAQTEPVVLVDQAQFVTEPGALNGYDVSRLHALHVSYGPGINAANGYAIGDDFSLAERSVITKLEVFGYQSYSTTTSTFDGLYFRIYDRNPAEGGQLLWGDSITNRMTSTYWTECYRCGHSGANPTNTERPIMCIVADSLNIELDPGSYFIAWGLTGTGEFGPYAVPVTIANQPVTGNAWHYDGAGWWRPMMMDQNGECPAGAAFRLSGRQKPTALAEPDLPETSLYPNPTSGNVKIMAHGMNHITVVSPLGQVVYDADVDADVLELDMVQWNTGVYVVRIGTAYGLSMHRVTVVR